MVQMPGLQLLSNALGGSNTFRVLIQAAAQPSLGTQSTLSSGPSTLSPHAPSKGKKPQGARRPLGYMPDMSKPDIPLEREKVQYDPEGNIYEQFNEVVKKRYIEKKRKQEVSMIRREELNAKMAADREMQSQKELAEVTENLRLKEEKDVKLSMLRQERDDARARRMAKLKTSNLNKNVPLHVAMEERYQQEVVLPAMEKQREMLRRMKEKFESPLKDIAEHESAYLARNREREDQHRQEIRRQLKEHNRHLQNWRSKKFDAFLDEERKKKEEHDAELAHKKEMIEKRSKYAKKVQGPLPPLKPKPPPEQSASVDDRRVREMGNEFMRQNKKLARKTADERKDEMLPEDSKRVVSMRNQGNEYMREAKALVARDANGAVRKREPAPPEAPKKELQPLRNKVRRLDRVFDQPDFVNVSNDPSALLKQQQQAFDAVAAMQAKLDLLQQLS